MSREAILNKIAEKLDEDSLLKLAAEVLTEEDIISLSPPEPAWMVAAKEAAFAHGATPAELEKLAEGMYEAAKATANKGLAGVKAVGNSMLDAGKYLGGNAAAAEKIPGANFMPGGLVGDVMEHARTDPNIGDRIPNAARHVYDTVRANPGAAAGMAVGGAAAMGGLYLLAKKMGLVGQQEEPQHKTVMASFNASPELDAHLTKLAQDKEVTYAVAVLLKNGLL